MAEFTRRENQNGDESLRTQKIYEVKGEAYYDNSQNGSSFLELVKAQRTWRLEIEIGPDILFGTVVGNAVVSGRFRAVMWWRWIRVMR